MNSILKKEVCRLCYIERGITWKWWEMKGNEYWSQKFEIYWEHGEVLCDEGANRIDREVPKNCVYYLEQII